MRYLKLAGLVIVLALVVFGLTSFARALQYQSEPAEATEEMPTIASFNRSDLSLDNAEVVVYGSLSMKLFVDLTEEEIQWIATENPDFFNKIGLLGWQRDGNRFYRLAPARDLDLHYGEELVRVRDGKFAFLAAPQKAEGKRRAIRDYFERRLQTGRLESDLEVTEPEFPFSLTIKGYPVPQANVEVAKVDIGLDESFALRVDLVENINFEDMKASMCHLNRAGKQQSSKLPGEAAAPMDSTCLDYNGPGTDGQNHPKWKPRAWVNFICSDCDVSFFCASCWNDHIVKGGCKANHGKICSYHIYHSTSYHKHKWSDCFAQKCRRS